jgi:uncharacterized protein YdhG (YjbR/CyaY superfamily)
MAAVKKTEKKSAKSAAQGATFTAEERAAMKERARELAAEARAGRDRAAGESELLARVAEMPPAERALATRLHELVGATAPQLAPKTWYGMPAWARDGKVVCFFQGASKFKSRYSTLGFSDEARLDDGALWPTAFALVSMSAAEERRIVELLRRAVG